MHLVTTNEALVNIIMYESDLKTEIHKKASKYAQKYVKFIKKFNKYFIKSIQIGNLVKNLKTYLMIFSKTMNMKILIFSKILLIFQ